jgi:hypothetical protein
MARLLGRAARVGAADPQLKLPPRDQSQLRQRGEPAEIAVDPGAAPDFDELAPGRVSEPPITPIRQGVDLIDARIPAQLSGHRA